MSSSSRAFRLFLAGLVLGACRATPESSAAPSERRAVHAGSSEVLGRIEFPNSGPAAAQEPFLRGVLLLHSFEYEDAAEAFRAAQAVAPDFALAYWGEALTCSHPLWQEEKREEALAVLARLAPSAAERAAKAGSARERGLLASVERLFGEGSRSERARAYCAALEELVTLHPDDLELAAFHALAILGTATQGRDTAIYMRGGAAAEAVLERAPDHPGALHYAIHAFDDPVHAPLGLRMARRYGVVASSAEHALHMPSHIYVALGLWQDSIEANLASSAAADARRKRKGLDVDARGFHSLLWLQYSYLQLGQGAEAARLLSAMRADEREKSSPRTRTHLVAMRAAYVIGLETFDHEVARFEVALDGLLPAAACAELYLRGRVALERGDDDAARMALLAMAGPRGPLETLEGEAATAAACCSSTTRANYLPGRLAARVMELQLGGLVALASGAEDEGFALLDQAAAREDAMGYDFGPPVVVEPAHELLGQLLLARGKAAEAATQFEAALQRAPNRARSLTGLARARAAATGS